MFAALVEFAIVLLVRHKKDLDTDVDRHKHIKFEMKKQRGRRSYDSNCQGLSNSSIET